MRRRISRILEMFRETFDPTAMWPYDLRHRRVSLLDLGGMPGAHISELVGHDDLVTTARTYTHVLIDERELDYEEALQ